MFNVRAEARFALETATWKADKILTAAKSSVSKVENKMSRFNSAVEAPEAALQEYKNAAALKEYENAASEVDTAAKFPQIYAHIRAQSAASEVANKLARIKAAVEAAEAALQKDKHLASEVLLKTTAMFPKTKYASARIKAELLELKVANEMAIINASVKAAEAALQQEDEALELKIEEMLPKIKYAHIKAEIAVPKVENEMARIRAAVEAAEASEAALQFDDEALEVKIAAMLPKRKGAHIRAKIAAPKVANEMARIKEAVEAAEAALQQKDEALEVKIPAAMLSRRKDAHIGAEITASRVANEMARIRAAVEAAESTTILAEAKAAAKDAKKALSNVEKLVKEECKGKKPL